MKLFKWLLWILKGKPMIHYNGYNCGCCGKWYSEEFDVPEYKNNWFRGWNLCPEGKGCRIIKKCSNCKFVLSYPRICSKLEEGLKCNSEYNLWELTDKLKCPKCGFVSKNKNILCLTSNPVQYEYICSCKFELRYFNRKNSFDKITQEELDSYYKEQLDKEMEYQFKLNDAINCAKADVIKAKAEYPYWR